MRSTRNEQVIESVRLPDLVSRPWKSFRMRAGSVCVVDADESLRKSAPCAWPARCCGWCCRISSSTPPTPCAKRAASAACCASAAEIVREDEREQLHLRCKDNGVGIARDDLERVFDKGYSTKSKDTNYGIGLHWCANAIAALGGRIWAASEGPGLGASMHLLSR